MDKDLDQLLKKRKAPPQAPAGLSERIIAAAQVKSVSGAKVWAWRTEMRALFAMPQPVVACALVLLLGALAGAEMEVLWAALGDDWTRFLYIDEDLI